MTWVRFSDDCHMHSKIEGLSDRAFRTWFKSICHCNALLTDGLIAPASFARLGASTKVRDELVAAELWHLREDGWAVIHDYLEYQPSRAKVQASRGAARDRMVRHRNGNVTPFVRANNDRSSPGVTPLVTPTPSHPIPNTDQIPPVSPPEGDSPTKVAAKRVRKSPLVERPADWDWTEAQSANLRNQGLEPSLQAEKFKAHHDARGNRFADWTKAGWTWCHNAPDFKRNGTGKPPGLVAHEKFSAETGRLPTAPYHRVFNDCDIPRRVK